MPLSKPSILSVRVTVKKIAVIFYWEFIQNLPLVLGFLLSLQAWRQQQWGLAITFAIIGSVVGALLIRATESKIVSGHKESVLVVITNIFLITALMLGVIYYLSSGWSRILTDWIIGGIIGLLLGTMQSLAAKQSIDYVHCIALALSTAIILMIIRFSTSALPLAINAILINTIVTLIIVLVDYNPSYTNNISEV